MNWRGELLHIHIAPHASAPMQTLSEARLNAGIGIEGDRYATRLGTYSQRHHVDRQSRDRPRPAPDSGAIVPGSRRSWKGVSSRVLSPDMTRTMLTSQITATQDRGWTAGRPAKGRTAAERHRPHFYTVVSTGNPSARAASASVDQGPDHSTGR